MEAVSLDQKTRPNGKVSSILNQFNKLRDIRRVVLPIAVNLNIDVVTEALGILMPSLDSSTDAQVLRKVKDVYPVLAAQVESIICRPVIYHDVVITTRLNCGNRVQNAFLLVISRNDNENTRSMR